MKYKKNILIFIIAGFIIAYASFSFAQSLPIESGLLYIRATQASEGYWGDISEIPYNSFVDTCTVAETLKYLNETGASYPSAMQWINVTEVSNSDYLITKMIVLAQAGLDVLTMRDYLLNVKNDDGGWGVTGGLESDVKRTALALQAHEAVNYADQTVINGGIAYLLSNQNSDGGVGFYPGDESNVYMTALFSYTLQQFSRTTSIATANNKATTYLIAHQNINGGFGEGGMNPAPTSTIFETSLAYMALVGVITDNTVLGNAITYLTSNQSSDGSWLQDPYSTAWTKPVDS